MRPRRERFASRGPRSWARTWPKRSCPPALWERHRRELFAPTPSSGIDVVGNRLETRGMRTDGTEFPVELTVTSILINKKNTFTVYVRDITARKWAEEAVVWLAAIVESSQDAIIGQDLEGRITSWNKGAERMYGYTVDEAIGKNISFLIPRNRAYEDPRFMEERMLSRRIESFETVRAGKDGKQLDVLLTISPVLDSDRTVIGGSIISRDITGRKITEEALRKANETSVYASPLPIIAVDTENHITTWNPAAEELFGWNEKEVMGQPNPIIPIDEADAAAILHQRLLLGEILTGVEVRPAKAGQYGSGDQSFRDPHMG